MTDKNDQSTLSEQALQKRKERDQGATPNHPPSDRTPSEGFHPIEREKPIDLDERAGG